MVTNRFNSTTEVPKGPNATDAKGTGKSTVARKAEEVIKRFE